mgnify:CR=1 FL=1
MCIRDMRNIPVNRENGALLACKETELLNAVLSLIVDNSNELAKAKIAYLTEPGWTIGHIIDSKLEYDEAVRALHARGISVITHQILGLPGETPEMMVETARYIGRSGAEGIKLHLLHVLAGTDLAADYAAGKFETLTLDAYITLLEACLRVLPREMVIHRLTGDGAKRDLLAPGWSGDKKRVINEIRRRFLADDLEQGSDLPDSLI